MAETREKAPAADARTEAQQKAQAAETKRAAQLQEQQAELNVTAFNIEAARRTGLGIDESAKLVERLKTEGDFFDEKGRWTLDVAGYPVCHVGWKEATVELP